MQLLTKALMNQFRFNWEACNTTSGIGLWVGWGYWTRYWEKGSITLRAEDVVEYTTPTQFKIPFLPDSRIATVQELKLFWILATGTTLITGEPDDKVREVINREKPNEGWKTLPLNAPPLIAPDQMYEQRHPGNPLGGFEPIGLVRKSEVQRIMEEAFIKSGIKNLGLDEELKQKIKNI